MKVSDGTWWECKGSLEPIRLARCSTRVWGREVATPTFKASNTTRHNDHAKQKRENNSRWVERGGSQPAILHPSTGAEPAAGPVGVVRSPSLALAVFQTRCESGNEQNNQRLIYIHCCVSAMRDDADFLISFFFFCKIYILGAVRNSSCGGDARWLMAVINQGHFLFFFLVRLFHAVALGNTTQASARLPF